MTGHFAAPGAAEAREPLFVAVEPDDPSRHAHRQFIGVLGLVLPVLLWLVAGARPTAGLPRWERLDSVSAYYSTGAVAAFVGVLVALGVFLFTYRGSNNEYRSRDRVAAVVAGTAAVLVAFFPTWAPQHIPEPPWWTPRTGTIHSAAAVVLFSTFSFFALFLFRKSKAGASAELPRGKRLRNTIYLSCGIAMVECLAWAGIAFGLPSRAAFSPRRQWPFPRGCTRSSPRSSNWALTRSWDSHGQTSFPATLHWSWCHGSRVWHATSCASSRGAHDAAHPFGAGNARRCRSIRCAALPSWRSGFPLEALPSRGTGCSSACRSALGRTREVC